jgi:hypothetical protein
MAEAKLVTNWPTYLAKGVKNFFTRIKSRVVKYVQARPYRSLRLGRFKVKPTGAPLPSVAGHITSVLKAIGKEKINLTLLVLLYAAVVFLVVGGLSQADFTDLKDLATQTTSGNFSEMGTTAVLFLGTISDAVSVAGTEYQQVMGGIIMFIFWLSTIWLMRMSMAGNKVYLRDALYNSTTPLVSSFLVLIVIVLQSLPAVIGMYVFGISISEGYLSGGVEAMMFGLAAGLLCLLSLYWVSASFIGLVMVSLPQTYPWQALSGASRLVVGQRWKLMKHMVALIVVIFVFWVIVLFPALLLDGWLRWEWLPLIPIVVQLLTATTLTFSTVYMYKLYRSLL